MLLLYLEAEKYLLLKNYKTKNKNRMSKVEAGHEVLSLHDDRQEVQALMKNPSVPRVWLSIISAFLIVASLAFALRAIGTWAEKYLVLSNAQAARDIEVAPHEGGQYLPEQISSGYLSQ